MLAGATRLLARLRAAGATSAAAVLTPPRRWTDELHEAGTSADDWLHARRSTPRLYVAASDETIVRLKSRHADAVAGTLAAAERVLRHEFDLLGSGRFIPVDPDRPAGEDGYRPIDWYLDPIRGLRFPRGVVREAFDLETMRPGDADIKLPWELARCQHWPLLGQAYRLTGDERFAVEIAREMGDFIEANPIGTAVNWSCTMDVALRAANWTLALELIAPCMPACKYSASTTMAEMWSKKSARCRCDSGMCCCFEALARICCAPATKTFSSSCGPLRQWKRNGPTCAARLWRLGSSFLR